MNLLIGVTGSVAAIKIEEVIESLLNGIPGDLKIVCILSKAATYFCDAVLIRGLCVDVYTERDEFPGISYKTNDDVLHIKLRRWADLMVVLPLSANTLSAIASGRCDTLLTSVLRAWEFDASSNTISRPILCFPAMNTAMWTHPVTAVQVQTLKAWGYKVVPPISKKLACGDVGIGAMPEVHSIVDEVAKAIELLRQGVVG